MRIIDKQQILKQRRYILIFSFPKTAGFLSLSIAIVVPYILLSPALAQETKTFSDWQVVAQEGEDRCFMAISVLSKKADIPLASINVFRRKTVENEEIPAIMTIKVPLGVSLTSGVAYQHVASQEAVGFAWQYCNQSICMASGGVSLDELANLKKRNRIELGYRPLPGSKSLVIPVSLRGFTAAWNELLKCS